MIEPGSEEKSMHEVEPGESVTPAEAFLGRELALTRRATSVLRVVIALVLLILGIGGFLAIAHAKNGESRKIQGKVTLSAQELKDTVAAKKPAVY